MPGLRIGWDAESGSGEVSCSVRLLVVVIGFVPLEVPGRLIAKALGSVPFTTYGYSCIFSHKGGHCQAHERVSFLDADVTMGLIVPLTHTHELDRGNREW
jgi:hypothetical protein